MSIYCEKLPDGRYLEEYNGVTVTYWPENAAIASLRRVKPVEPPKSLHGNDKRLHANRERVHAEMRQMTGRV